MLRSCTGERAPCHKTNDIMVSNIGQFRCYIGNIVSDFAVRDTIFTIVVVPDIEFDIADTALMIADIDDSDTKTISQCQYQ